MCLHRSVHYGCDPSTCHRADVRPRHAASLAEAWHPAGCIARRDQESQLAADALLVPAYDRECYGHGNSDAVAPEAEPLPLARVALAYPHFLPDCYGCYGGFLQENDSPSVPVQQAEKRPPLGHAVKAMNEL